MRVYLDGVWMMFGECQENVWRLRSYYDGRNLVTKIFVTKILSKPQPQQNTTQRLGLTRK